MKIAIATEYNDPAAEISHQGARSLFFHIYDAKGRLSEILANPYAGNSHHVGPDVANMLDKLHVTKVIAGRFGHKFSAELRERNIEYVEQNGVAAQAAKEITS
ncbi:MAG: NifB/NifX family molybdenum-iron cluster-binding protein [Gammaproteobacteria bacterium]|jgi:predicted Fe-Mo cluster-binding NifX family protein